VLNLLTVPGSCTDPRNVDSDAKIRLNRSATEPIGKGLSRACNTLSKRKKSKTKEEAVWEASMFDLDGSTFVEDDVVGDLAWKDGGLMQVSRPELGEWN